MKGREMKFGNPLLSSELSGALGGVVGAKARGGVGYFRVRSRPGNPRSAAQSLARLAMAASAAAWLGTLTDPQREAWTAKATGSESGIDAFVRVNSILRLTSTAPVDDPPVSLSNDASPITGVAMAEGDTSLAFTIPTTGLTRFVAVFINKATQTSSRLAQQRHTSYLGRVAGSSGSATISLAAVPGILNAVEGDVFYVRFVQFQDTGEMSTPQTVRVVVAAA